MTLMAEAVKNLVNSNCTGADADWTTIGTSNSPDLIRLHLARYPKCSSAGQAHMQLAALEERRAFAEREAERQRRAAADELERQRRAAEEAERRRIAAEQEAERQRRAAEEAEQRRIAAEQEAERRRADDSAWNEAVRTGTAESYSVYLTKFWNGTYSVEASRRIVALQLEEERLRREREAQELEIFRRKCDDLAANPYDPQKPADVSGSRFKQLEWNAREAVEVCTKLQEAYPSELRYTYQLARSYQAYREKGEYARALALYESLVARNYPAAFDNLGWMYLDGTADRVDQRVALQYFQKGARLGDPDAMLSLARLLLTGQDTEQALRWLRRAAGLGHTDAAELLQGTEVALRQQQTPAIVRGLLSIVGGRP